MTFTVSTVFLFQTGLHSVVEGKSAYVCIIQVQVLKCMVLYVCLYVFCETTEKNGILSRKVYKIHAALIHY